MNFTPTRETAGPSLPRDAQEAQSAPTAVPSILFRHPEEERHDLRAAPDFFRDLNLDRIVAGVIVGREDYDLTPFFQTPLIDRDAIVYRQEVMRDFENQATRHIVETFAKQMRAVRGFRATEAKAYYAREKQRWRLAAAEAYAAAVEGLARDLAPLELASPGLHGLRDALADYCATEAFHAFAIETREVAAGLGAIHFGLRIRDGSVQVRRYEGERDYSAAVEETFRKFAQAMTSDLRLEVDAGTGLNHVDAAILDRVALLNPEAFEALARFWEQHADFVDPLLAHFDREAQFYLAWLDYIGRMRDAGLPFCYPALAERPGDSGASETFDLALADKLLREGGALVRNDFFLRGPERVLVVTGPNQGGKTTFARTFGQLHHLAALGVPVAGRDARLIVCDRLFTHFEREEDVANLRGKLEDDLLRIHTILEQATSNSVVVMNEIFSSTTVEDGLLLAREVLGRILRLDLVCVCVTFLDELASLSEKTVSLVGAVDAHDPTSRTYKLERRPANGLAYALALAEKHRLTYDQLKERIRP